MKHGISADAYTQPGNCATFLLKVGGVVEGLFQDMVNSGSSESKVSRFNCLTTTEGASSWCFHDFTSTLTGWFRDSNVQLRSGHLLLKTVC